MSAPIKCRNNITSTHATFSPPEMPSLVRQSTNIQIHSAKQTRTMTLPKMSIISAAKPPSSASIIIFFLLVSSWLFFFFAHRLSQGGHLCQQFLEAHAGQTLHHRRQLGHDLGHVAGDLAGAASRAVAAVDDHHPLRLRKRLPDLARNLWQHPHAQLE